MHPDFVFELARVAHRDRLEAARAGGRARPRRLRPRRPGRKPVQGGRGPS